MFRSKKLRRPSFATSMHIQIPESPVLLTVLAPIEYHNVPASSKWGRLHQHEEQPRCSFLPSWIWSSIGLRSDRTEYLWSGESKYVSDSWWRSRHWKWIYGVGPCTHINAQRLNRTQVTCPDSPRDGHGRYHGGDNWHSRVVEKSMSRNDFSPYDIVLMEYSPLAGLGSCSGRRMEGKGHE